MSCEIAMEFYGETPELCKVSFLQRNGGVLVSYRGKTGGAMATAGSFQWTSAVKGLCAVLLRHNGARVAPELLGHIGGGRGSLASSLDYAISKGPQWLADMFGSNENGDVFAKRLFRLTNPNRKRPGPVLVAVNPHLLPAERIHVFINGTKVNDLQTLRNLIGSIEETRELSDGYSLPQAA